MNRLSCLLVSGIGCLISILTGCKGNKEKATVQDIVKVEVEVVEAAQSHSEAQTYSGTVESANSSTVSFSVPGTITKIYVEEGQHVTKGQLIAQIKSENLINARNIAQAELEEARDAYQRLKKLHDADALPAIKWVEIQAKLKQAENAAAVADRAVGDATIHSPISGYITEKLANDGQNIIPAEPIVTIVELNDLQVAISVPENEISSFVASTSATVTFGVTDSLKVTGKMAQKGVIADPLTRSYKVKFDISDTSGKILPGMIGNVVVDGLNNVALTSDSIKFVLPSQAVLLSSDNKQFVWVVKGGKAYRKYVTADELDPRGVIVKSGLENGDSIIVAGMQKVSTGNEVKVVK